jgi:small-conductance mechanosensitive channel
MVEGILQSQTFPLPLTTITSSVILYAILVIVIAYLAAWVINRLLSHLAQRTPSHRIQITMTIPFAKIIIYSLALYIIATAIVKPDVAELVAFFGLFGAILAFGVKDLFSDIVGGLIIMLEKPFQIGDKIAFGQYYGEVTDIGLRSTRLLTPDESLVTVPNFTIFNQPVSSSNAGKMVMLVVTDLHIDPRCDSRTAMRIAREAAVTSKFGIVSPSYPCQVLLLDNPFYRTVRVKAYVNDVRSEFTFKSDITLRAWEEYYRQGVSPPRPGIVVPKGS